MQVGTPSLAQRHIPQGDQRVPLRVGAETYAAFRSVVSTAKLNSASVLDTIRFVLPLQTAPEAFANPR